MIILDTNVLSAIMKPEDNPIVSSWLDRTDRAILTTTTPTIFEVRLGIELMAKGRKRRTLEAAFQIVMEEFTASEGRILPLDRQAAEMSGRIFAARKMRGVNIDLPDTMIAGIAVSRGLPIVTRNVRHFDDLAVTIINPWEHSARR